MRKQYKNIPIFIPGLACPFQCIFCDQNYITGNYKMPGQHDIHSTIAAYLSTTPNNESKQRIQIAFFGGNFTGLSEDHQNFYLDIVNPYLQKEHIESIRISTRPDYVNAQILDNLKRKGVRAIELGAQSLNDKVLEISGRGHTADDIIRAARLIKQMGFELGLQMMTGLPGDNDDLAFETAERIIELGAETTRIYPTIVIEGTQLASLYRKQVYFPQSLDDSVLLSARLVDLFLNETISVLRIGLLLSENQNENQQVILAGPYHPAYGELVFSRIWFEKLSNSLVFNRSNHLVIYTHSSDTNAAIGHKASNKKFLQQHFSYVHFKQDNNLPRYSFYVNYY